MKQKQNTSAIRIATEEVEVTERHRRLACELCRGHTTEQNTSLFVLDWIYGEQEATDCLLEYERVARGLAEAEAGLLKKRNRIYEPHKD